MSSDSSFAYNHAIVVGKFAPFHAGHQLLIETALQTASELTVLVWANPDYPEMPNEIRSSWIHELYPSARVLIGHDGPHDDEPEFVQREYVATVLRREGLYPDVVLTSETYGEGFAAHLGLPHVLVDLARGTVPISGTAVRSDVHGHRSFLDPRVYKHFVERVVLLGAESTGKSTLVARLAAEFDTTFVAEYGREYYEERNGELVEADYLEIARRHRAFEDEAILHANRYMFVDTNAATTMLFSHLYNRTSAPELRALAHDCATRYQHVIVCDDDIAFEQDGWRDTELWRTRMQGIILFDLAIRGIPYSIVSGSIDERVQQVRAILANQAPLAEGHREARSSRGPRPTQETSN
jgi:HTH-type transcriptional regulator, transcriptional repressor of NAD biosynthesis genes